MLSSVEPPRWRASGLEAPMLEPLAVDPNRSLVPAANSIASARLVFPAPAGPTSAITRVPLLGSPAMRLSFVPLRRRESLTRGAQAPMVKDSPSACFQQLARGVVTPPAYSCGTATGSSRFSPPDDRSQRTSRRGAATDAAGGVEGHRGAHLQEGMGRQRRPGCRGRRLLQFLCPALASGPHCARLRAHRR